MTVREFLTNFLDLQGTVTSKVLTSLVHCCTDEDDKEMMKIISNSKDEWTKKIFEPKVGLIDLRDIFKSFKPSLDVLVNKCQMIMPRYYTIASSSVMKPRLLTVALSIERFDAPDGKRIGLVSKYL